MSSLTGSVLRYLERILKKMETRIYGFRFSIPSVLEYVLIKLVDMGNATIRGIVKSARVLSKYINMLQISMIDSMIIASLWYGFMLLLLVLIILYITYAGG